MFRTNALVLNVQKIRDQQTRIILFTNEYGKIHCWSKKATTIDIGVIAEVLVERKGVENHVQGANTCISIHEYLTNYADIDSYLGFIEKLGRVIPEGVEYRGIYTDIEEILLFISDRDMDKEHEKGLFQLFILLKMRVFKKIGILREDTFSQSPILQYIYTYIDTKTPRELCRAKKINPPDLHTLFDILEQSYHTFIHGT